MNASELLRFLQTRGVLLSVDGKGLRLNAPKGVLTGEIEDLVAARRAEIIELLKDGPPPHTFDAAQIPRASRDRPIAASPGQAGLWYLDQIAPGDTSYSIIHTIREQAPLDLEAQERALNSIIARHEVLRTTFREIDGQVCQIIAPELTLSIPVRDFRGLPAEERERAASSTVAEEARRPFDLARGPLIRYRILRLADDEWICLLVVHHIIFDGWSLAVFNREMRALFAAFASEQPFPLADLPIQYADYADWQREQMARPFLQGQLNYWRQQLAGPLPLLQLPCARPHPATRSPEGLVEYRMLPGELNQSVQALARQNRATPFITYLAAFSVLLHRYSLQDELLVGSPIAGRNRIEIEGLLGFFVNMLVLRIDASGNPAFRELLSRVRKTSLDAFSNQDVPFEELVRALQPERRLSHTPLFQVMFNLVNVEPEAKPWNLARGTAKYDLTLTLVPTGSGIQCVWEYSSDLFEAATIRRLPGHFETLLTRVVASPDTAILEIPLTTEAERQQLLSWGNGAPLTLAHEATIPSLFQAQAARTPDVVAVRSNGHELSYRELNARANGLAHLLQAAGVGPGARVGVCLERSLEVWVGLLAVLKAGGAYVPLDPNYPRQRLAFMLANANVRALITQKQLVFKLPEQSQPVFQIDTGTPPEPESTNIDGRVGPDDVAYVIYTSGSTGQPKGVEGTHRGAVNRMAWMWGAYPSPQGKSRVRLPHLASSIRSGKYSDRCCGAFPRLLSRTRL